MPKKRQVVLYGEINQVIREFIKKSIDALKRKVAIATFDTTCLLRITNYELRITIYVSAFRQNQALNQRHLVPPGLKRH
jgi:hypothetical protein